MRFTIEVSNNGQDFTSGGLQYVYEPGPTVSAIKPYDAGLKDGTTTQTVTVPRIHFVKSSQLTCSVGDHATWVSSSLVMCVMDKASLGIVTIEVSNNRKDFSADGIEYADVSSIYSVTLVKLSTSSGPANGGTLLTLTGKQ